MPHLRPQAPSHPASSTQRSQPVARRPPRLTGLLLGIAALIASPALPAATLADTGITLSGSYTGESAAVVDGGKRRGSAYAGQFFIGADVDLARLAGWSGATVRLYGASRHGDNLSRDEIGNSTSIQEIFGGQTERLANFTLEQQWLDGRLLLEAGRTVANIHFLGSELCQYFQTNSACGNPTFVFRTSNFTYWPVSSWGAHAKGYVTPSIYLHAGAYEVNPRQAEDDQHGLEWSTRDATGLIAPYAIGYKTTAATAHLPSLIELGGWYDTSDYRDPLRDASGAAAAISGLPYASRSGRSGAYFRVEQRVTRSDPAGNRGLTLFGAALIGTHGEAEQQHFLELGLVQRGTLAGRDRDTLGLVVSQQRYSDQALDNQQLLRAAAGGSGRPATSQVMVELSYGIQVNPLLRVQPNLHYIANPDQFGEPARTRDLPDALAVGLRVDLSLSPFVRDLAEAMRP